MIYINKYEKLLDEAYRNGILILEDIAFESHCDGLIKGNVIGLSKRLATTTQKATVVSEELGHFYTTSGIILDQSKTENRKQERKARLWAYNKQIGLIGLVNAFQYGCHGRTEVAEYLGVTEEFLEEAVECYRSKYGCCAQIDDYTIFFDPALAVMKKFDY